MTKVFCTGDSSVNVFLQIPNETENVSLNQENRLMQLKLGSKTQLESEIVTVGGNALNVAIGLSRQGINVDFYSIIGKDIDGDRVMNFLSSSSVIPVKAGIQVPPDKNIDSGFPPASALSASDWRAGRQNDKKINLKIERKENVKTNVGYVINFQSERFLLIDTSVKNYNSQLTINNLQSSDWVFLSSIGPKYEEFFREMLEFKSKIGFKLAYNPSSNELKNEVGTFIEMVKASDILFVNKKEAGKILTNNNQKNSSSSVIPAKAGIQASSLGEINKKIVVITDGKRGSWVFDGEKVCFEAASSGEAKEKTGAGDAYESGFLAEFLKTGDIQKAMKNGTENAGSVIKYIGAVEGLQYK